mmetsp:Transcript_4057/g.4697  ORF Transcript_4057/g.4697 Transcript_4057/m.4697 type:complete len:100 (+) Transcript_4057:855-1154(+)
MYRGLFLILPSFDAASLALQLAGFAPIILAELTKVAAAEERNLNRDMSLPPYCKPRAKDEDPVAVIATRTTLLKEGFFHIFSIEIKNLKSFCYPFGNRF